VPTEYRVLQRAVREDHSGARLDVAALVRARGHLPHDGYIRNADDPANGVLNIRARTGAAAPMPDLATEDFTVTLQDDDQIFSATVPRARCSRCPAAAGSSRTTAARWAASAGSASAARAAGSRSTSAPCRWTSPPRTWVEHVVEARLSAGDWAASHVRLWTTRSGRLETH
jgi:hypothetical protein